MPSAIAKTSAAIVGSAKIPTASMPAARAILCCGWYHRVLHRIYRCLQPIARQTRPRSVRGRDDGAPEARPRIAGRGEPSPSVAGVSPVPVQMWEGHPTARRRDGQGWRRKRHPLRNARGALAWQSTPCHRPLQRSKPQQRVGAQLTRIGFAKLCGATCAPVGFMVKWTTARGSDSALSKRRMQQCR